MSVKPYLRVALPVPLHHAYDYRLGEQFRNVNILPGSRVCVPFGRHANRIGVVLGASDKSAVAAGRLKSINQLLDEEPLFSPEHLKLLHWAADYYHHPIGEVLFSAMPALLRQGRLVGSVAKDAFRLSATASEADAIALARAPAQRALLQLLRDHPHGLTRQQLRRIQPRYSQPLKVLLDKGLVALTQPHRPEPVSGQHGAVVLNEAQLRAVQAIAETAAAPRVYVLQGVTGSGKTEVYIEAVRRVIARRRQALILVPEIGLTAQFIERLKNSLAVDVRVQHSALNESERLRNWLAARDGTAPVVLGARSAVWTPLKHPGIYVVDEEHDSSYKQDSGFRYSAKDIAVVRAKFDRTAVALGSATPALETVYNLRRGKYARLCLPDRATGASPPAIHFVNLRHEPAPDALARPLLTRIAATLEQNNQVLLFLNRRGYAPVILCRACGWYAECERCSVKMTWHKELDRLICHHCDARRAMPEKCPECGHAQLKQVGHGTQRLQRALTARFPQARILRVDRDSVRRKGSMEQIIKAVTAGEVDILVGTQMIAKGYHFPRLTLVGIIDADSGLLSADFRAVERMAQLLVQVGGRAGRAAQPGAVLIQTHFPDHPLLQTLVREGYDRFCDMMLAERREARLPPYSYHALLAAEAAKPQAAGQFLRAARAQLEKCNAARLEVFGPVAAPIEKRKGYYRSQLLVQSGNRQTLRQALSPWRQQLELMPVAGRVRWFLDIDPQDML